MGRRPTSAAGDGLSTGRAADGSVHGPLHSKPPSEEASAELARISSAALGASLEAIPSPAFVVRLPSTILYANTRGRALLSAEWDRTLGLIRATTPPPRGPVRFPIPSAPDHNLVVIRDLERDALSRLDSITLRWGLTPRQSAVLALVAQGESNRTVATRLGCSEKTVELHVSALLSKTRCVSRSQLVASFWTDLG